MTKAFTLDEARRARIHAKIDAAARNVANGSWSGAVADLIDSVRDLADSFAPRAIARQEIAAVSDGDRTRADDAQVGGEDFVNMSTTELFAAISSRDATIADLERRLAAAVDIGEHQTNGANTARSLVATAERERDDLRAQLDEKDRRIGELEAVRDAGRGLSNAAFNISQRSHLTDDERRSLREGYERWDKATAALSQDKEGSS